MPDRPAGLPGRLRRLPPADLAGEPDAALLDRFAAAADDAPFAELVRRHGPMVLGVCRRLLGPADADDAFQATFLVLARKAGAVRGRPVGGWLCRVAGHVARRHRDRARRRRRHERHFAESRPAAADPPAADDLAAVLADELGRLPDRERAAVVACLVQGLTQEAAARALGWSFGTLRRRLDRGKDLLLDRLARRGFAAPAGFAGLAFTDPVPPALADLTRVGAVGFARGVKTAGPAVALAEGVLTMMTRTKLLTALGLVAAAGLAVGTGWAVQPAPKPADPQPPAAAKAADPAAPPPPKPAPAVKAADPAAPPRIRPGDRLRIVAVNTFEQAPINGVYTVEPTGHVALGPVYGRVRVLGDTYAEAEVSIRTHLKLTLRDPQVQVAPADPLPADPTVAARLSGLEARVKALEDEVARLKAAPNR